MKTPQFIKNDNVVLHLLIIIIAAAAVWGLTCGLWSLSGLTEGYYISVAKEMLTNGKSVFSSQSQTLGQQPPLVFWLFALALKFAGAVSSLAPRLVSVIFACVTLTCTYYCGRRLISPKAGFYSAFILATCPVFMTAAAKVAPNMVFAALITISITAIITRKPHERAGIVRAVVIWLSLILAFLSMGLMAPIMIILFIVLFLLVQGKELANEVKALRLVIGILAGVVIMAIWLFLEYHFTGSTFIKNEFSRFGTLSKTGIDIPSWWYYFAHAGHILGIWAVGLVLAVLMLVVHKVKFIAKWYLWLFWFVPGFALLCLIQDKNIDYILPLLPPLALFIGYYLSELSECLLTGKISGIIALVIGKIIMLAGIIACTLALILFVQLEFAWQHAFYIDKQGLIVAFVLGLVLIFLGSHKYKARFGALFGAIVLALLIGNAGYNAVVRPAQDVTTSSRYFTQNLQNMYPELADMGLGIVNAETAAPDLHIYATYKLLPQAFSPIMFSGATAVTLPDFVLMTNADYAKLALKPEQGGFAPVFWDIVAGKYDVILLKRQTDKVISPTTPMPLIFTVPKPLLLAGSQEMYTNVSTEDKPQTTTPADDEAALKTLFGPDEDNPNTPVESDDTASVTETPATPDDTVEPASTTDTVQESTPAETDDGATTTEASDTPADTTEPVSTTDTVPESTPAETDDGATATEAASPQATDEPAATTDAVPESVPANTNAKIPAADTLAAPETTTPDTATPADSPADVTTPPEPAVKDEATQTTVSTEAPTTPEATPDEAETPVVHTLEAPIINDEPPVEPTEPPPPIPEPQDEPVEAVNPPVSQAPKWRFALIGTAHADQTGLPQTVQEQPQTDTTVSTSNDTAADLPQSEDTEQATTEPAAYAEIGLQDAAESDDISANTLRAEPTNDPTEPPAPQASAVALNAAKCILPQGFILIEGTLTPYLANCAGRNAAMLDINTYQPHVVRFYSVNLNNNGFKDNAYALHWFKTQSGRFGADYNMLVLNNLPQELAQDWPYTPSFNRWAMQVIKDAVSPQAVFFTGLEHAAEIPAIVNELYGADVKNMQPQSAVKMQINFGLRNTDLALEFKDDPVQIYNLQQESTPPAPVTDADISSAQ